MSLWAIIPVKPLRRGKSRLAGVLTEDERTQLNFSMLGHILKVLKNVPEVDHALVISRDPAALALAREYDAKTLLEDGSPALNTALRRATAVVQAYSSEALLILPADLPLVQPEDIQMLIALAKNPPVVVIAPDRHGTGTNALLVSPAGLIDYSFGPGSFQKHCDRVTRFSIHLEVFENRAFALDLDLPEDLEMLHSVESFESGSYLPSNQDLLQKP